MQLICVLETTPSSQTDWAYVKSFLDMYYLCRFQVKLTPLYLKGKANFNKIGKQIQNKKKEYFNMRSKQSQKNVVCFFMDTDFGGEGAKLNLGIEQYCKDNGFRLVWFHRDVEEVFLGKRVSEEEKKKESISFVRHNKIAKVDLSNLNKCGFNHPPYKTSNIKLILDQVFIER